MSHRIAIDMDEVLADTLAKELSVYNLEHHANVTKDDLAGQKLYQKFASSIESAFEITREQKTFFGTFQ